MNVKINVKHFAKIETASIELKDLILFVGENNTGKSMMMMLIYAVLCEVKRMTSPGGGLDFSVEGINKTEKGYTIQNSWIKEWEKSFNDFLYINKEKIIEYYFKASISIEELAIDIELEEDDLYVFIKNYEYYSLYKNNVDNNSAIDSLIYTPSYDNEIDGKKWVGNALILHIFSLSRFFPMDCVYLPASRTGLQLLHRYFFSEKDKMVIRTVPWVNNGQYLPSFGLTMPVYDFLQFLLTHHVRESLDKRSDDVINFINQNLLDGKLEIKYGEDNYVPSESTNARIPLYLASSMINEVSPLVKILTSATPFSYIFYDEIETCLHPLKQGYMARTIVRMVNSGWKMIVSTHSDTMASNFNNLLMISHKEKVEGKKIIEKLGYDLSDILTKEVRVYEFQSRGNNSRIEEVQYSNSSIGYDFNLFTQNINKLYEETEIISL